MKNWKYVLVGKFRRAITNRAHAFQSSIIQNSLKCLSYGVSLADNSVKVKIVRIEPDPFLKLLHRGSTIQLDQICGLKSCNESDYREEDFIIFYSEEAQVDSTLVEKIATKIQVVELVPDSVVVTDSIRGECSERDVALRLRVYSNPTG